MSCEISIVCSCRNDNYGENLLDRIHYFMRSIDRFTVPIEIILVDMTNKMLGFVMYIIVQGFPQRMRL